MNKYGDRLTNKHIETDIHTYMETDKQKKHGDRQKKNQKTWRQTNKQKKSMETDKQIKKTWRQTNKQIWRQTDK